MLFEGMGALSRMFREPTGFHYRTPYQVCLAGRHPVHRDLTMAAA
jgi:hypothetical protein